MVSIFDFITWDYYKTFIVKMDGVWSRIRYGCNRMHP
jgi:hypothetical protein